MPKKLKKIEISKELIKPAEPIVEEPKEIITKVQVFIKNTQPNCGPVAGTKREFSLKQHGDKFQELAEAFRKRFNGEYI